MPIGAMIGCLKILKNKKKGMRPICRCRMQSLALSQFQTCYETFFGSSPKMLISTIICKRIQLKVMVVLEPKSDEREGLIISCENSRRLSQSEKPVY